MTLPPPSGVHVDCQGVSCWAARLPLSNSSTCNTYMGTGDQVLNPKGLGCPHRRSQSHFLLLCAWEVPGGGASTWVLPALVGEPGSQSPLAQPQLQCTFGE